MYKKEEEKDMSSIGNVSGIRNPVLGITTSILDLFQRSLALINGSSTGKDAENLSNLLLQVKQEELASVRQTLDSISVETKTILTDKLMSGINGCDDPVGALNLFLPYLDVCSETVKSTSQGGSVTVTPFSTLIMKLSYSSGISDETKCALVHAVLDHVEQSAETLDSFMSTNQKKDSIKQNLQNPCFLAIRERVDLLGLT